MIYGIYISYWYIYIYIHDIIYWWITYVWNINRIKWTMDFQYNLRVWGRRNMDEGTMNVFLWRGDFKHVVPIINAFLILFKVALCNTSTVSFLGISLNLPLCFSCRRFSAVSPHLRQAMRELDVAIRVDPVDKFVEIMSHIAIDLPSTASFGTREPHPGPNKNERLDHEHIWTQKQDKRIHPVDALRPLFWDYVIYHLMSCVCVCCWKGNQI